ncbi:MAG TPA: hypothetical protein VMZ24_05285 [Patescibacteria group bacterium]|nr:hypothetical protein [Patescibacteria group bacterium]
MTNSKYIISFDETPARLKITIPDRIRWSLLIIYTLALATWIAMIFVVISYLLRGQSTSLVLSALLVLWLLVWLLLGRFVWTRWQYQAAKREVIFIDEDQIVIRRPVSILGITTAYDIHHVSPFYISEKHNCPAFDYAYMHVYFGRSINPMEAQQLIDQLNTRLFPENEDDD